MGDNKTGLVVCHTLKRSVFVSERCGKQPWRKRLDGENGAEGFDYQWPPLTREGLLSMSGWATWWPGLRWFPSTDQEAWDGAAPEEWSAGCCGTAVGGG